MASNSKPFRRFVRHSWLSITLFVFLVAAIFYSAWQVTEKYKQMPDFGGIVTIRQGELDLDFNGDTLRLTQGMIMKTITAREILVPLAKRYGWDKPYDEMVKNIEVKERLSSQRSFSILVNTMNAKRSNRLARALAMAFLEEYQKIWEEHNKGNLQKSAAKIKFLESELKELKENRHILQKLIDRGVNVTMPEVEKASDTLEGKTFVVTGTLSRYGRKDIEELILSHGGKVSGSVSKKTGYLIAGENAGSKLAKAQSLGVPVLTEDEFEAMIK